MESKQVYIYPYSQEELIKKLLKTIESRIEVLDKKRKKTVIEHEELLTVEETMKLLKCSKQALWNWRKNGILPSYRLGNRVYYKHSEILTKLIKQE
ncbi:helix-turn-helix domain-containing protein [Olleya aquimaris]|uniref:Helix-turn-helix protein n=1 Tax=Olleya aquimaris TaxID=639310 RepID=A0A327RP38_9FLAO|nr:helix-turn-helix domain-containing protein [Olleya aquimaris]RAJ17818.1 helix-turn-helix protein [Olleya aquimaris]